MKKVKQAEPKHEPIYDEDTTEDEEIPDLEDDDNQDYRDSRDDEDYGPYRKHGRRPIRLQLRRKGN